jgi:tRNA pseudouridine38-40 synthase
MDASSPGWREALGAAAEYSDAGVKLEDLEGQEAGKVDPRTRGEYERRRAWRVDQPTLERFRALIDKYTGTQ